jgi:hypothetical protein
MADPNPYRQFIATGSQFTGAAPNATFTAGGLWTFPGQAGNQPMLRVIRWKTTGTVVSVVWRWQSQQVGSLNFDNQMANFTVGKTATGAGGATGVIYSQTDSGASGTLRLKGVTGTFVNNEALVDNNGTPGAALVDGTFSKATKELYAGGTAAEYEEVFVGDGYPVPLDDDGTPQYLQFVTTTLSGEAWAECEWDFRRLSK